MRRRHLDAVAREPERGLDEARATAAAVRAPERVEPGRDARAPRTRRRRSRSGRAPRRTAPASSTSSAAPSPAGHGARSSRGSARAASRRPSRSRARRRGARSSPSRRRTRRARAATAASAALPPSARISTRRVRRRRMPGCDRPGATRSWLPYGGPQPRPRAFFLARRAGTAGDDTERRRMSPHQGREAGDHRQARPRRTRTPARPRSRSRC